MKSIKQSGEQGIDMSVQPCLASFGSTHSPSKMTPNDPSPIFLPTL